MRFRLPVRRKNALAVAFEKRWQPHYLNHPKSLKSFNLLNKHYVQWSKYRTRYACDIYGNIAIILLRKGSGTLTT